MYRLPAWIDTLDQQYSAPATRHPELSGVESLQIKTASFDHFQRPLDGIASRGPPPIVP
jgi:hypothetical protein